MTLPGVVCACAGLQFRLVTSRPVSFELSFDFTLIPKAA